MAFEWVLSRGRPWLPSNQQVLLRAQNRILEAFVPIPLLSRPVMLPRSGYVINTLDTDTHAFPTSPSPPSPTSSPMAPSSLSSSSPQEPASPELLNSDGTVARSSPSSPSSVRSPPPISPLSSLSSLSSPPLSVKEKTGRTVLVMSHGFGSGIGMFFPNFANLATMFDRVLAFDWVGMGCSSRPPRWHLYSNRSVYDSRPVASSVVDYFSENVEEWRHEVGIEEGDRVYFFAHSLGGYLAARYALRHPDRLSGLILVSPVGIPDRPEVNSMFMDTVWNYMATPQQIVRAAGSERGKRMVAGFLRQRMPISGTWSDEVRETVLEYLYGITTSPSSSEHSINSLLAPVFQGDKRGVFARESIGRRLVDMSPRLPTLLLYGDHDWMYKPKDDIRSLAGEARSMGRPFFLAEVEQAGHLLYMENPTGMHAHIARFLEFTTAPAQRHTQIQPQ